MRDAYATSSSRNTSALPTPMKVGGKPERSSARAGAAYIDTSIVPRWSPSNAFQPVELLVRSQTPMPWIWWAETVSLRIVEHGAQEHRCPQLRTLPLTREESHARGESAAGTSSADDDTAQVDAQFCRVFSHPDEPGVAVLNRDGVGVGELWCESVLCADDDCAVARDLGDELPDTYETVTDDHAAPMNVKDPRALRGRIRVAVDRDHNLSTVVPLDGAFFVDCADTGYKVREC